MKDGSAGSLRNSSAKYPVGCGGVALVCADDGTTLSSMRQLSSMRLTEFNPDASTAAANNVTRRLTDATQVYMRQDGGYYSVGAAAVNTADYELTGWYDDFTGAAGGAIRIVIAVPRETE